MVNISSCVSILLLWIYIFVIYFKYLVRDNFRRKLFLKNQEHHERQQHRNTMELSLFNLETSLKMNIILVKWSLMQSETSFLNISTAHRVWVHMYFFPHYPVLSFISCTDMLLFCHSGAVVLFEKMLLYVWFNSLFQNVSLIRRCHQVSVIGFKCWPLLGANDFRAGELFITWC